MTAGTLAVDAQLVIPVTGVDSRLSRANRNIMMKLRNSHAHPTVQMTPGCKSSLNVIKKGPANIPQVIKAGKQYVDPDFGANMDTIYWNDYLTATTKKDMADLKDGMDAGLLNWYNWQTKTPQMKIFDGLKAPSLEEPLQGNGGTCYIIAAMTSAAEKPDLLK